MVSTTNFGTFPGVRIETYGEAVTGVQIGEEEKLVLFGEANLAEGEASEGEAINTPTPRSINNQFGGSTELSNALQNARGNGANSSFLYGATVRSNWADEETVSGTASSGAGGSASALANAPLYGLDSDGEDVDSYISFYDTNDEEELVVSFTTNTPGSPNNSNNVNVNPVTGEWNADEDSDYEVTYQYFDNVVSSNTEGTSQNSDALNFDGTDSQPVIEDKDRLRVFDNASDEYLGSGELEVRWYYGDVKSATVSDTDVVYVNPITGNWKADSSPDNNYSFFFVPKNFKDTFDDVDGTVEENESGIYAPITESEEVASVLSVKTNSLRSEYKMVQSISGAQPTDHNSSTIEPSYDTSNYDDAIANDAYYLVAPVREAGTKETVIPAVAGQLAGSTIAEPVYGFALSGITDISQKFSKSERDELRQDNVIPIKDVGTISLDGNISTSEETDYARTFFVRRVIDRIILFSKAIGDSIVGRKNTEDNRTLLRNELREEMEDLVDQNVIVGNVDDESRNWYVEVTAEGFNEVGVEIGVTPVGVIKRIDEEIIIDTSV